MIFKVYLPLEQNFNEITERYAFKIFNKLKRTLYNALKQAYQEFEPKQNLDLTLKDLKKYLKVAIKLCFQKNYHKTLEILKLHDEKKDKLVILVPGITQKGFYFYVLNANEEIDFFAQEVEILAGRKTDEGIPWAVAQKESFETMEVIYWLLVLGSIFIAIFGINLLLSKVLSKPQKTLTLSNTANQTKTLLPLTLKEEIYLRHELFKKGIEILQKDIEEAKYLKKQGLLAYIKEWKLNFRIDQNQRKGAIDINKVLAFTYPIVGSRKVDETYDKTESQTEEKTLNQEPFILIFNLEKCLQFLHQKQFTILERQANIVTFDNYQADFETLKESPVQFLLNLATFCPHLTFESFLIREEKLYLEKPTLYISEK